MTQNAPPKRTWADKFHVAFLGWVIAVRQQSSFRVHLVTSTGVIGLAIYLQVVPIEWCLLILCMTLVLAAETLNTSLEWLAASLDKPNHPQIGAALDLGAAAVLISAMGAAAVGAVVFIQRLVALFG